MQSKGFFIFGGESSADYGIYTAGSGTYNSPTREVTTEKVAGRNGLLARDDGSFSNVNVVYTILLKDDFKDDALDVKAWLLSNYGYQRLEDSFNPNYYRMARFADSVEWTVGQLLRYGYCDITFDCLPQLFLKSGEESAEFTESGTITNPTRFESLPLIHVVGNGNGTLTVGDSVLDITNIVEYVDIDSDLQDAYHEHINWNDNIVMTNGFPKIKGETEISFEGGITSVEIIGRWWTV